MSDGICLGKRLKELRQKFGLSQKELAAKIDISTVRYSQYETGKRSPDYETLLIFADFFEVSVDFLLGRDTLLFESELESKAELLGYIDKLSEESIEDLQKYIELLVMKEGISDEKKRRFSFQSKKNA